MALRHPTLSLRTLTPTSSICAAVLLTSAALMAGCGGDDDDDAAASGGSSSETGGSTSSGGSTSGSGGSTGGSSTSGGSSSGGSTGSGGSEGTGGAAQNTGEPQGLFTLKIEPAAQKVDGSGESITANTTLIGRIWSVEPPPAQLLGVTETEGDCQLLEPLLGVTCDPGCTSSQKCVAGNVCAELTPPKHNVGTVSVSGVAKADGTTTFTVDAVADNYQPTGLAFPPCAEGDEVTITSGGGDYDVFNVSTECIVPLDVEGDTVPLAPNQATTITMNPPAAGSNTRIEVNIDISHHGGLKGEIVCDFADTGSITIPAGLITSLINLGVAGFPSVTITRVSSAAVDVATGQVGLRIISPVAKAIEIPGLVSCTEDSPCTPLGQVCNTEFMICAAPDP